MAKFMLKIAHCVIARRTQCFLLFYRLPNSVIARNVRSMSSFVRHCEKSFSFSWQSIILSISKDSIVKIFYMQDYGLLRSFHS
ncbi:hypothetical protein, partial [Helicobacter rodentium]|uniref:hypothetical protein n=1 Tax=Helicobacter rodentium TaxID=59617 RepID=UPI002635A63D